MPRQTGGADSSVLDERGVVSSRPNSGLDDTPGVSDEAKPNYPQSFDKSDREVQRQRAIEQQDPALLPVCTDEELIVEAISFAWRSAAQ